MNPKKAKKEAFVKMYQKDPRISHEDGVAKLQQMIDEFDPTNPQEIPELEPDETIAPIPIPIGEKRIVILESFSDDNEKVTVSNNKRVVTVGEGYGYCFINHPKNDNKTILQWTLRVAKHGIRHNIGTVTSLVCTLQIILNYITYKIIFKLYLYNIWFR